MKRDTTKKKRWIIVSLIFAMCLTVCTSGTGQTAYAREADAPAADATEEREEAGFTFTSEETTDGDTVSCTGEGYLNTAGYGSYDEMKADLDEYIISGTESRRSSGIKTYAASSYDSFIQECRDELVARESGWYVECTCSTGGIAVTNENIGDLLDSFLAEMFEDMYVHTGVPYEGDYLFCTVDDGYVSAKASGNIGSTTMNVSATFHDYVYYTTQRQEEAVDSKVSSIIDGFGWASCTSDYEKVKDVYGYLCDNITYDYENSEKAGSGTEDTITYTAYAGLINGTCVCQGYAAAFYRIILEEGIDCRAVYGVGTSDVGHMWNIVKLGGSYYNLDATWDAGKTNYTYFLLSNASFKNHTRDKSFGSSFDAAYPMSSTDYDIEAAESDTGKHTVVYDAGAEPTCTEKGMTEGTHCSNCGRILSGHEEIEALDHDLEIFLPVEPTATTDGNIAYCHCLRCGKYFPIDEEGDMGGEIDYADTILYATDRLPVTFGWAEDYSSCTAVFIYQGEEYAVECAVTTAEVPATCMEEGRVTYHAEAFYKGFDYSDEVGFLLEKDPDNHVEIIHTDPVDMTDTEDGNIEYYRCTGCGRCYGTEGDEIEESETIIHNLVLVAAQDATEDADGNISFFYCVNCGAFFDENGTALTEADIIIPAYGSEDENDGSGEGDGGQIGTALAVTAENTAEQAEDGQDDISGTSAKLTDGKGQADTSGNISVSTVQTGDHDAYLITLLCLICGAAVMLCMAIRFNHRKNKELHIEQ